MGHLLAAKLVRAASPLDLINQVEINQRVHGMDLYTPLFVGADGVLCQFMTPMASLYEYRLIMAGDLNDLELQANNLINIDYDFLYSTVMWQGLYLQWMQRMNSTGQIVQDAIVGALTKTGGSLLDSEEADPELRADELKLVEGVREALGLGHEPVSSSWVIPFPLRLS